MTPTTDQLDVKAHLEQRNAADQAHREGKEVPKPAEVAAAAEEPAAEKPHQASRSERRLQNRLREEIGELRGRLKAYEELGMKPASVAPAAVASPVADPEPQRKNFASDAEYNRALGRWDARQEVAKATERVETKLTEREQQAAEMEQLRADIAASETQAQADIKELFPDWEQVSKDVMDDPDSPEYKPADHPMLMMMIARSDVRARVLYHFAKNPEALESMLGMTKTPDRQIAAFHRLEGRVEKLYDKPKVAQAAGKGQEERATHPAEANAGRSKQSTSESDARKPRPSSEVTARGGTAVPEEPVAGSAAWMAARNARTGGR